MSKKLRFFIEYFLYYLKTYSLVIILGIISGSLIYTNRLYLIQLFNNLTFQKNNIGLEGLYTISNLPEIVSNQISYGITTLSENDKAQISPIVDKIEVDENNQNYTIFFKNDIYWHNGRKFQTSDLNLNIAGAQITNKSATTMTISLPTPFSPLLSFLSQPLFYNQGLIGLGKYQVADTTYQDGYLKTISLVSVTNSHDQIFYHFYQNSDDLINAFKLGEVSQIITTSLNQDISSWPNIKINPDVSTKKYLAIFFNTEKISSKSLRQSLAYATPKTSTNNRCLGPISPTSWAYNPQIKPYNYNPTRAKELLDKEHPSQINLIITDRQLLPIAESIKKSWQENLSIDTHINIESQKPSLTDYEAILTYGTVSRDPDQYTFWHSTQINTNITHLDNSRIDKLLEEGRLISNQSERKQIYYDFQKFLLEESPVIFLEFPISYNISRIK
ncbi:MAG: ABC transporter substrate-binding protein [Microgenomates group bacterium]